MADAAVPPRKILLCGDVGGSLNALYKRFETARARLPAPAPHAAARHTPAQRAQPAHRHPSARCGWHGVSPAHSRHPLTLERCRVRCRSPCTASLILSSAAAQVNKAAGPFEAIFCVGRFCGAEEGAAGDLPSFVEGTASAPVPTYFVDGLPGGKCVIASAAGCAWR
jgi:hypothetical protein